MKLAKLIILLLNFMFILSNLQAIPVALQNATATFSQGGFEVEKSINGTIADDRGWAIAPATNQTAVYETVTDLNAGTLSIFMDFQHSNPGHLLGRYRFSVTTDDRSTFANGLSTGGDVTANWTVLTSPSTTGGAAGTNFSTLGDNSVLVSGTNPSFGSYTTVYNTNISGVTGIRLEVIEDPSLPSSGPGRFANGNFVISELIVNNEAPAVPEPSSMLMLVMGAVALGLRRRK